MPGNSSKRWQWSEDLLLPSLGACARASWQWPLAQLALGNRFIAPGAHLAVWLLLALLLLPNLLSKALGERRYGRYAVALGGLMAILLATLATLRATPAELWSQLGALGRLDTLTQLPAATPALLLALAFWLEGSAANWLRYAGAWRNAILGATALVLLNALYAAWGRTAEAHLAVAMVAFLLANLLALALLAVRGALALEQLRHSRQLGVNRYWLSAMVGLILLLLLAGLGHCQRQRARDGARRAARRAGGSELAGTGGSRGAGLGGLWRVQAARPADSLVAELERGQYPAGGSRSVGRADARIG